MISPPITARRCHSNHSLPKKTGNTPQGRLPSLPSFCQQRLNLGLTFLGTLSRKATNLPPEQARPKERSIPYEHCKRRKPNPALLPYYLPIEKHTGQFVATDKKSTPFHLTNNSKYRSKQRDEISLGKSYGFLFFALSGSTPNFFRTRSEIWCSSLT